VSILYFVILFSSNRRKHYLKKNKKLKIKKLIIKIGNKMHKGAKSVKQDNEGLK